MFSYSYVSVQSKSYFVVLVNDAYEFMGVTKEFIAYLVEQLPGGHKCRNYKFQHHLPCLREDDNVSYLCFGGSPFFFVIMRSIRKICSF